MKLNIIAFLSESGVGSEFEVGFSAANLFIRIDKRLFLPYFQFVRYGGKERTINGWKVKRITKNCLAVCIGFRNKKPTTAVEYRTMYFLWLHYVALHLYVKKIKYPIWIVTLAQVLSPVLLFFPLRDRLVIGPAGGQAEIWKYPYLIWSLRFKNYIITRFLYKFATIGLMRRDQVILCHPKLKSLLPNQQKAQVHPAIEQKPRRGYNKINAMANRKYVLYIGRKLEIKGCSLIFKLFNELAPRFPGFEFQIIGSGWIDEQVLKNFEIISELPQAQIYVRLNEARLHIFPSFELAGYVILEAARMGCANFCFDGFGGDYLVEPSANFLCSPNETNEDALIRKMTEKISLIINNNSLLSREAALQYKSSLRFISTEKEKMLARIFGLSTE